MQRRGFGLMIAMAIIFGLQIAIIRGDFGEGMKQGSCIFWRLDCANACGK